MVSPPQHKMDTESEALPVAIRDSEERLSKGGLYLLETGLNLFLWVGASAQQELLQNVFGTPAFGQIDPNMVSPSCCLKFALNRPFLSCLVKVNLLSFSTILCQINT